MTYSPLWGHYSAHCLLERTGSLPIKMPLEFPCAESFYKVEEEGKGKLTRRNGMRKSPGHKEYHDMLWEV